MLLVYGEAVYRAVCGGGLGLHYYTKVGLAEAGDDDAELAPLFRKLTSRAVVIWPEAVDDGYARALSHAALLVEAGVTAVGIVRTPEDYSPSDARACADAASRAAQARAWPAQAGRPARAVAPWNGAVDGAQMFAAARGFLARHLAEPATTFDAIVLWCLQAWCVQGAAPRTPNGGAFDVSARLVLAANDARADHARALRLIAWLTPAPLIVSRTLAAYLLPTIEAERPTLLLDDVGGSLLYRRDMRTLIAAGALRDGMFLGARTKRHPTGRASCFAPAAIATTAALPDDVRMRAIVVPMAPPPAEAARERQSLGPPPEEVFALRAQMQAFAAALPANPGDVDAALPRHASRSVRENWHPLMAISHAISARVAERAAEAASVLADMTPAPASNLALLSDIRENFGTDPHARLPTAQVIEKLTADPEQPWASARRGAKIDPRALAERLRGFGVRPVSLKVEGSQVVRGYRGEDLCDAFARYLGAPSAATGSGTVAAE